MFIKLIKHNLKSIFKNILPLAAFLLFSVIFFSLTAYDTEYIYDIRDGQRVLVDIFTASEFQIFLNGLAYFMMGCSLVLLVAVTIKAIWRRFSTNFYSDEAYLTHTLPVSRHTLWNAHICSTLITFVSVIIFIILNCFILLLTASGQRVLNSFGLLGGCVNCVGEYHSVEPLAPSFYLGFIFIIFVEFLFITFCGLTGIVLKNRTGKNIGLLSGLAIYFAGSCLLLGVIYLVGLSNILGSTPVQASGAAIDLSFITRAFFYIGLVYTCYCTVLYFIDQKLLQRGINLS